MLQTKQAHRERKKKRIQFESELLRVFNPFVRCGCYVGTFGVKKKSRSVALSLSLNRTCRPHKSNSDSSETSSCYRPIWTVSALLLRPCSFSGKGGNVNDESICRREQRERAPTPHSSAGLYQNVTKWSFDTQEKKQKTDLVFFWWEGSFLQIVMKLSLRNDGHIFAPSRPIHIV